MRRLLLLSVLLLAFPAAARPTTPPPATTPDAARAGRDDLRAPGRFRRPPVAREPKACTSACSAARPSSRPRTTNPDGSYRIKVAIARPGPFHAEAAGRRVAARHVRIVPFLDVELVGPRVAGSPLPLRATLRPTTRDAARPREALGRQELRPAVRPERRRQAGDDAIESFQVVVEDLPSPGSSPSRGRSPSTLRPPSLTFGARSPLVAGLLHRLGALGYEVPGDPRRRSTTTCSRASTPSRRCENLDRTGVVDATFWAHLDNPGSRSRATSSPAAHIEVDKAHQVLYVVRDGQVKLISPVSTAGHRRPLHAGRPVLDLPQGPGYDPSPLGILYKPMYFTGGYAIHGNPSVPPYPASHGCVRVPNFVIDAPVRLRALRRDGLRLLGGGSPAPSLLSCSAGRSPATCVDVGRRDAKVAPLAGRDRRGRAGALGESDDQRHPRRARSSHKLFAVATLGRRIPRRPRIDFGRASGGPDRRRPALQHRLRAPRRERDRERRPDRRASSASAHPSLAEHVSRPA